MLLKRTSLFITLAASAVLLLGGCAIAQSTPPATRPFGNVASEESGEVVSVHDTMIDLRTGQSRSYRTSGPVVPLGPVAISVPVTVGGESRRAVPGEELTVKLASGKLILVVQEQGHPAFAVGEQVRVLHEEPSLVTNESRTRVER